MKSNKHHRHSIRLQNYDYSSTGAYFITLCTESRILVFGNIEKNTIELNEIGNMIRLWWQKIFDKFNGLLMDNYIIMPNHIHGIINIVGANPCVRPNKIDSDKGQTRGSAPTSISTIIQWFKTMITNRYINNVRTNNWKPFNKRLWQRNYYEHIVRNEQSLGKIREYIVNNPINWPDDENNPVNFK